ncbi:Protein deadpan [Sergentomyia squamirostris]
MMPIREDDLDNCNNNIGGNSGSAQNGQGFNISGNSVLSSPEIGAGHGQASVGAHSGSAGNPTPTMTKAELRKSNKPIMEKKRRARINESLEHLKRLILEATKKDPARHTKLEKADILEMTVKYLQTFQRQQFTMAMNTDPTVIHKFRSGFTDCAEEVSRYVSQMDGLDSGVKQRLANHLNNCVTNIQQLAPSVNYATAAPSGLTAFGGSIPLHNASPAGSVIPLPQDVNNNGRIQMGGVQLIPSRLPTGELALVMPNSSNLSFFPSSTHFPSPAPPPSNNLDLAASPFTRSSAFSSVSRQQSNNQRSPPLSPVSSISSCGEDSHTSSDWHNSTSSPLPPVPSTNTVVATITSNLQQPQVSSTTEQRSDVHYVNKKRPYPFDSSELSAKTIKLENPSNAPANLDHNQNSSQNGGSSADMWRPW